MLKFLTSLIDRGCAVLGAAIFVQLPLFIHQYMQQLTGRVDELKLHVDSMHRAAALSNKSLNQYIQKFVQSSDIDFSQQGNLMLSMVNRWQQLSEALLSLQNSSSIEKPFLFLSFYNHEIAKNTLYNFQYGLLFTAEGATYGLIGMMAGYMFFILCQQSFKLLKKFFKQKAISHN